MYKSFALLGFSASSREKERTMSEEGGMGQVIQLDEVRIQDHLGAMVRGTIVGKCMARHRAAEFRRFLAIVEKMSRPTSTCMSSWTMHQATHKAKQIRNWFAKRPH
jgi:hypothetical protein